MFFKWLVLGKGGVDDVGREPAESSDNAVSVYMNRPCTIEELKLSVHQEITALLQKNVGVSDAGL